MAKRLPPEDELAPGHDLGGDPTDEDVEAPDLEDYDTDPEEDEGEEVELEDVAIPAEEDDDVEDDLEEDPDEGGGEEW